MQVCNENYNGCFHILQSTKILKKNKTLNYLLEIFFIIYAFNNVKNLQTRHTGTYTSLT